MIKFEQDNNGKYNNIKNPVVSFARVFAMFLIIMCHICTWQGFIAAGQLFNVGVELFLLISGVLHAKASNDSFAKFIKKKWCRICIPLYIVVLIYCILSLFTNNNITITKVLLYVLNLQGIGFIFPDIGDWVAEITQGGLSGMGHTWFLTVIILCYILWYFVVKIVDKKKIQRKQAYIYVSIVLFAADVLFVFAGIELKYFVCFFVGCVIGCDDFENITSMHSQFKFVVPTQGDIRYMLVSFLMIVALVLRLATKMLYDGTYLYDSIVVGMTHIMLAVWIFETCKALLIVKKIGLTSLFKQIDEFSYYIYLCHYIFVCGYFSVRNWNYPIIIQFAGFCVLTIVMAAIVKWLDNKVKSIIVFSK